ncbi:unnamed protein product, partial [Tenebrio molitor]
SDVFLGLVNTTRTIGFLVPDRKRVGGVDRTVRTPDTEGVLQSLTQDGTRSVRNVADILNQSKNTVQNVLKDYAPRLELQEHEENPGFLANVLLTNE